MKSLTNDWLDLSKKYDLLSLRERWMIFCAALVVVYAALTMLFVEPQLNQKKKWLSENADKQLEVQKLHQQLNAFKYQQVIDPDAQNKLRIQQLQDSLRAMDAKVQTVEKTLLTPNQIPELLRHLLKENTHLKLIELKSLPPESLLSKMQSDLNLISQTSFVQPANNNKEVKPEGTEHFMMFEHGVDITVEGRYLDLLDYVATLERLHQNLLWNNATLVVENYPVSRIRLKVSTISINKTWLSI